MATKKVLGDRLRQVVGQAKMPAKLVIIHMPDHPETSPHWLFWLLIISLVALVIAIIGTQMAADPLIQTYLPSL